jgi:hypothetical protein
MKKLIMFRRFRHVHLYSYDGREEFKGLWSKAGTGNGPGITEKNRFASDQIRARLYCYAVPSKDMPSYSNIAPGLQGNLILINVILTITSLNYLIVIDFGFEV